MPRWRAAVRRCLEYSLAQRRRAELPGLFPEDAVFLCATLSRKAYSRALWGAYGSVWESQRYRASNNCD